MGVLERLFSRSSRIPSAWAAHLSALRRPPARHLLQQLTPGNVLGYEASTGAIKSGSLLEFVLEQKQTHPDKVSSYEYTLHIL